jgi:adenosine deaminase
LIVAADRTVAPSEAVEQAKLAAKYGALGVVGFGLANDEVGYPPAPFAPAYDIARAAGLLSVPHAGELVGPESVRSALDDLHADRIAHGVRAVEDPALVARLAASTVCLDVCPTSNLMLAVVPSIAEHPLRALIDAGVRCSLNADDPLLFGPNLLEEYELVRAELGFDDATLASIARCSVDASGAPDTLKASANAAIDRWLAAPAAPGAMPG